MKLGLSALMILIFLFSSCAEEDFYVSSLSLHSSITIENGNRHESLVLRAAFSDSDESYTYRLESPSGDLVWEGTMSGSDILSSEPLEITEGAMFSQGEYSILFYSTNGTELSTSLSYASEESYPHFEDGILTDSANVREYDAEGSLIREGERDAGYALEEGISAEISLVDRYGNSVMISYFSPQEV